MPTTRKPTTSRRPAASARRAPARKTATRKTATRKTAARKAPVEARPAKPKLVRDSFTFPGDEYAQIAALKQRAVGLGHPVKKSELLRAGLKLLVALGDKVLLAALSDVPGIKTGRPKTEKADKADKPAKAAKHGKAARKADKVADRPARSA
jgi:hypothetical protein